MYVFVCVFFLFFLRGAAMWCQEAFLLGNCSGCIRTLEMRRQLSCSVCLWFGFGSFSDCCRVGVARKFVKPWFRHPGANLEFTLGLQTSSKIVDRKADQLVLVQIMFTSHQKFKIVCIYPPPLRYHPLSFSFSPFFLRKRHELEIKRQCSYCWT